MSGPRCEAEERLLQVAYEIELQWGAGRIDLGRLKSLATGEKCSGHHLLKTGETRPETVKLSP